jgi:DNA polymerase-3 subunit gamma/tau
MSTVPAASSRPGEYVVVARRYRPQTFADLVGQEHVGQALSGAITTNRVGHAYLFTGARGVGKTSAARILAKALNCVKGPTPTPCNQCDVCQSISSGDDVDVLEVDGASNRGIDEIRELRQNVNVRPSRSRFKVYIIDEVHMLTREAFNALLKTLEEPPEHVKFIFCTTEAEKIPITILSRCQRFDFAGIQTKSIAERLRQIVETEGVTAEPEALEILARRAAGSMRDSQSLLEQLLACGGTNLTVADVHRLLGTAGDQRLSRMAEHLVERDAASALADFDTALSEGVDVGQLLDQLLGYFRDLMMAAVGCSEEAFLYVSRAEGGQVRSAAGRLGIETILAVMQILDQTLARLKYSTHGRTLAELALVRICKLADLQQLADLIADVKEGTTPTLGIPTTVASQPRLAPPPAPASSPAITQSSAPLADSSAVKKKSDDDERSAQPLEPPTCPSSPAAALTAESAPQVWTQALALVSDMVREYASTYDRVAISAPNRLVVSFRATYTFHKSYCERPEVLARLEQALTAVAGQTVRVEFRVIDDGPEAKAVAAEAKPSPISSRQRLQEKAQHPLVRRAMELFDATPVRVEPEV